MLCMDVKCYLTLLREQCKLQEFKNKVLRKIFECKKDEPSGQYRILHNEELHLLYTIVRIILLEL